ncbi:MAG: sulfatase [Planctomycetota bacterium]
MIDGTDARADQRGPTGDHILLITIDDLNDWVGCLSDPIDPDRPGPMVTGRGHPQASTPNLDRLAKRGVLFTNAHCQAPICRPSRISFMSGLRPTTTGVYANRAQFDADGPLNAGQDVPWMTKRFEAAGYEVFTAGKVLHASRNAPLGGTPCFPTSQGPYPEEKIGVPPRITPAGIWDIGPFPPTMEQYTDYRIAEWMAGHIQQPLTEADAPRFFALGFYNPHVPLLAPPPFFEAAPKLEDVLLGATREDDFDDLPEIAKRMGNRVFFQGVENWLLADEQELRKLTQAYLACTTAMDACIGQVIEALDRSDLADNTWVVVLSDHGWHLGEKDHIAKQTLWSRSTQVPLIIVPPRRMTDTPRGVRCDRPTELIDIYPTLLAAAALPPTDSDQYLDGLDLLPWLTDPNREKPRPALTTIYAHNHSLVGDRYRYTRYADGSEELYDRQNDPHEFDNLINQVERRPDLQAAIDRLSEWIPENEPGGPDLLLGGKGR